MNRDDSVLSFMLQEVQAVEARPAATAIRALCRQPRRCRNHCCGLPQRRVTWSVRQKNAKQWEFPRGSSAIQSV